MSDYISREAALTELQNPELFNVSPRFLQILRDLPTADVEPVRHGRWVDIWGNYTCSECEYMWEDSGYKTPFCPICGAKMDLEDDNGNQ